MKETTARRWAYTAAAAGMVANGLFAACYVGFAVQDFGEPHGVVAVLGSAADYAGIPQNVLLAVVAVVVCRFLSRWQWPDRILQVTGMVAGAAGAAAGVATVTGALPGVSVLAIGAVAASSVWLLAIGIRGADLPDPRRARGARIARLIAATMLCSGALMLAGFAANVVAIVFAAGVTGCLAWLAIPVWILVAGRALARSGGSRPVSPIAVNAAA